VISTALLTYSFFNPNLFSDFPALCLIVVIIRGARVSPCLLFTVYLIFLGFYAFHPVTLIVLCFFLVHVVIVTSLLFFSTCRLLWWRPAVHLTETTASYLDTALQQAFVLLFTIPVGYFFN